ncbi:MAG: cell division protein FtsL [Betaproteobacteria bacterium]|nr:cell division protein FtsL [Betaproteobacteria bacterium]
MLMRWQFVLLMTVVLCALSLIKSQHQARRAFISLQQAQSQQIQLDEEWGRLQLEQSTWAMHARVGKIASEQLQMQLPDARQMRVVSAVQLHAFHP